MSAVEAVQQDEPNAWWTTLKHDGVLLSPIILEEIFPEGPPEIEELKYATLRRGYRQFRNDPDKLYDWLDLVFENLLGHNRTSWVKETNVPPEFRRGNLRPNRVLLDRNDEARAMVVIDKDRITTDEGDPGQIGIYSGKKTHADLVRLLRETGTEIGILTNGHQFRVVHATLDHESWTEWEANSWFQGGEGRRALRGFYGLLSDTELPSPLEDEESSLVGRIEASRDRQADLSDVMGTQVREAVELLIRDLDGILMEMTEEEREQVLAPLNGLDLSRRDELRARYQAAIRIVMRLVVALYAESRELFPKENPVYYESYSVEGLFRELREARIEEGEDTLEKQFSAWQQLQALSRLVYFGSPHQDVPLRAYGGRLFRPPGEDGDDDVLAGLSVFEDDAVRISDATVLEVLEKLKIAEFRSGGERRTGPVDFSDLRTEYIGMMYEGLLDYELREATEDDGAIIFLNIGDEPALPFNVLENLDDDGLENLVDNLKDNASDSFLTDEEVSEEDFDEDNSGDAGGSQDQETDEFVEIEDDLEARIHRWAKRVVEETGAYMPHHNTVRAMDPTTREKYEIEAARRLIDRIIRPGGTYLVSYSGTRKSTGTFYTPPGLAVPTVHRTLEPLVYDETAEGLKEPRQPEEILDLQICDPAMGSGTFPVAALRYLTDALKESFEEHVFPEISVGDPVAAPLGETAKGYLNERLLDIRMGEDEDWQDRLEMQLKRSIVERCIYGVDINPLAVELGKLSLWIETLDPKLPFTFLDHKLRVGNSLIGAWLDQFEHYPVAAWNREGGDGRKGDRTERIKDFRNGELKDQMQTYIRENLNETHWFEPETADKTEDLLKQVREAFENLHESIDEGERERLYREEFQEKEDVKTLRHLMNRWCAVWFWPMDSEDTPVLDPNTFYNSIRDERTESIVRELANRRKLQFFHWELEFPDVFETSNYGFDAVIGNPPWDTEKPSALEFFSRYRPEFRTYGKRESKQVQKQLFEDQPNIREEWLDYIEFYRGFSNFVSNSENPWDIPLARGKKSKELKQQWREIRDGETSINNPYRYQGSADLNSYKLFAEQFHFLCNQSGRIGSIFPAGLYSDFGNQDLRRLFLNRSSWEWIYSFENRNKIFDIHNAYKFCAVVIAKEGRTETIRCKFMVHELDKWANQSPAYLELPLDQIEKFSPDVKGIIEVQSQKDIDIISKIYDNSRLIRETGVEQNREIDMGTDSQVFVERDDLEENDLRFDSNAICWKGDSVFALPLLEGRHIDAFDYQASSHVEGHGRSAKWDSLDWDEKKLGPRYWICLEDLRSEPDIFKEKLAFMKVTSASNRRTIRASLVPPYPCGDSIPVIQNADWNLEDYYALCGILNSYALDYVARTKIQGVNANWYLIESLPFPEFSEDQKSNLVQIVKQLHLPIPEISFENGNTTVSSSNDKVITDVQRRAKLREEADKIVADMYGLSESDMSYILRSDNDDPRNLWKDYNERLQILNGAGNWGEIPLQVVEK